MKLSLLTGLILMALATSCSRPEKPFAVPDLKEVSSVRVSHVKEPTVLWYHEIRDIKRISELLAHLSKHNTGYRADTRLHDLLFGSRNHEYFIVFTGEDVSPLRIWIGPNWLGGEDLRKGEPWTFRYRHLGALERKNLLALISERDPKGREIPIPTLRSSTQSPTHLRESEPWAWDRAADRFNREKGAVAAILLGAEKVEPYKVEPTGELDQGIDSQKIVYKAKPLTRNMSDRLATLLLDPRSYISPGYDMKLCVFEPRLAFRFWKQGEFLDILICFDCNQLMVIDRDPSVRFRSLGGRKARFRVGGDFDPVLGQLRMLVMQAFPGDSNLRRIVDPHALSDNTNTEGGIKEK